MEPETQNDQVRVYDRADYSLNPPCHFCLLRKRHTSHVMRNENQAHSRKITLS